MKARLINEIKRNQEGSGLGAIGIGRAAFLKTYTAINKLDPNFESLSYPIKDNPMVSDVDHVVQKITNTLECSVDDLIMIKAKSPELDKIHEFLGHTIFYWENNEPESFHGRYNIRETYHDKYHLSVSIHWQSALMILEDGSNRKFFYFIRYK